MPNNTPGSRSPSGVFIADDFRNNLIIDRFDSVFVRMKASKLKHMRSENSEDVATWNVFRTLRQIDPSLWAPQLLGTTFKNPPTSDWRQTTVELWKRAAPPTALLADGDEGDSEIDIVVEHPHWVLFIEAKLNSDISMKTSTRATRDQVLRNIDVGSYYAGVRDFYFALLVRGRDHSPKGITKLDECADPAVLQTRLPHRPDKLTNVKAAGQLTWGALHSILAGIASPPASALEAECAARCVAWLAERGLVNL